MLPIGMVPGGGETVNPCGTVPAAYPGDMADVFIAGGAKTPELIGTPCWVFIGKAEP